MNYANISKRLSWQLTMSYMYTFLVIGIASGLLGPTIGELYHGINKDVTDFGFFFMCRGISWGVGSAIMGLIADRWPNRTHSGLLFNMASVTITVMIMPYMPNFGSLLALAVLQGGSFGCLELLGNILLIRLHREEVGPYRQALSFCFGFGAFLGPLLAEPFLGQSSPGVASPILHWAFMVASLALVPGVVLAIADVYVAEWRPSSYTTVTQQSLVNNNDTNASGQQSVTSDTYRDDDHTSSTPSPPSSPQPVAKKRPVTSQRFQLLTLSLVAIFLFCYVGSELGFGTFLHTYVHEGPLQFSPSQGALVTSVYWGLFSAGRLLGIWLSVRFAASVMVLVDLAGVLVALIIMLAFERYPLAIWIGSAMYGAFLASVYPSTFDVINLLIEISGRRASLIVISGIMGEMAVPALLGLLFDKYGAATFLWINFALCAGSATLIMIVFILGGRLIPIWQCRRIRYAPSNEEPMLDTNDNHDNNDGASSSQQVSIELSEQKDLQS